MSRSRRTRTPGRSFALLLLCVAALVVAVYAFAQRPASAARAVAQSASSESKSRPFVPGEILVRFRGESKALEVQKTVAALALAEGREVPVRFEQARGLDIVRGLRLARVPASETEAALAALRARADVLYAEPNYVRRKFAMPNDPRYAEQWAHRSNTQFGGAAGPDLDSEPAWDITTGSRNVVVGVVDEGVDINHQDLQANVWTNTAEVAGNGVDDDGNGYADDVHGWDFFHNDATVFDATGSFPDDETDAHGTHVAGIVGAVGNNGVGVAGVNWQVSLLPLKVLGSGPESPASSSVLVTVRAYAYAKALRDLYVSSGGTQGANVRVLNNSYGGIGRSQAELDAINALNTSGILFVAAAGNDSNYNEQVPVYPSNYDAPNLVSVAATDRTDVLAGFSNRGHTSVHMSAPGVGILSTTPGNTYTVAEGTSMAAPHVAGVAALLCAKRPDVSVRRMRDALMLSGEFTNFLGFNTVTGRRLNAKLALDNLDSTDATPPSAPTSLQASIGSREIRLNWVAPGDDGINGKATLYEVRYSDADLSVAANWNNALKVGAPFPGTAFTPESLTFNAFYGRTSVNVGVRAVDEAGNAGPVTQIHLDLDPLAVDPYVVKESAAEPLSTGGTALGLVGDDAYKNVTLPFEFSFYGFNTSSVRVSTNGTIYPVAHIYPPLTPPDSAGRDFFGSVDFLTGNRVIAAAWDDLRTDRRAGDDVYMVQPDADRVIFRWQAVTFDTEFVDGTTRGENPVNFEVELRRDGTVVTRYGAGNAKMLPVVGVADGAREPYVSASHTSEEAAKDLTNAGAVTFERRKPDTTPSTDVRVMNLATDLSPAQTGKRLTYSIAIANMGGLTTAATVADVLPPGTNYVSCSVPPFQQATCSGPAAGTNGTVNLNFPALQPNGTWQTMSVTVDVVAAGGTVLTNTVTATTTVRDSAPANNTRTITTPVVGTEVFFGAKQVSARTFHTLALKTDGTVWGWGNNRSGQTYDGTKDETRSLPAQVKGLTNVSAVASGANFGLALKGDGTVWAWGDNTSGQLGNADVPAAVKQAPVQVKGLTNIVAIAAGESHGVALKSDGTVWAWGHNGFAQLGVGKPDMNPHFVPLFVASGVKAIAAGFTQTYAVKTDGTVWVCGSNPYGMAGQPASVVHVTTMTKVEGLSNVSSVVAGENSAFALKSDGTLWAWGDNSSGQFGDGARSFAPNPTPVQVPVTNVVSVAASYTYVYAAKADGTLWCWGNVIGFNTPAQVPGVSNVATVTSGTQHAAALLSDSTLRAWGANDQGQLGDGTILHRNAWVEVSGLQRVATPTVTPDGGQFWPHVDVTVNCATPGAVMRYTVNSFVDPTESDPVIADGATLRLSSNPSRIRVRAWKDGMPTSPVKESYFNVMSTDGFPTLPNPIDTPYTFVTQHYKDFLSREPDTSGQNHWTGEITSCQTNAQCVEVKRNNVSAAFFLSIEFQETGYFVYRLERASFNRLPRFRQFMADTSQAAGGVIVNTPEWEKTLEENKNAFAQLWTLRADFKALYDSKTNAEYVDALFANAGMTPSAVERDALVNGLGASTETRATVLRKVADSAALRQKEYNRAFVLMQYFGYLRRDPDEEGYGFWLKKLDDFGGDWQAAEMVKAFVTSIEYRQRFGAP
ncbi:MAG TPA: S8 family serine peptidase [Pyrinomonadaceae bacterium]